jgi:hypothetical protein
MYVKEQNKYEMLQTSSFQLIIKESFNSDNQQFHQYILFGIPAMAIIIQTSGVSPPGPIPELSVWDLDAP